MLIKAVLRALLLLFCIMAACMLNVCELCNINLTLFLQRSLKERFVLVVCILFCILAACITIPEYDVLLCISYTTD